MKMLRITLEGRSYEVGVELLDEPAAPAALSHPVASVQSVIPAAPVAHTAPLVPAVAGSAMLVSCPMAGKVFKCLVKPGDQVAHNQVVLVLDAMKMETPVVAPVAGSVCAVLVKEGDSVDEGDSLLQIEPLA